MVKQIFKPIKQERLSVKISNQIKQLIVEGELKPGDPLPPERELMKLFNVSRPSIREALKSLTGMGFLEATRGNRPVVRSLASGRIFEPLDGLLRDDINIVFELIEVRKAIEAWNAYYAAQRATPEDLHRLQANIDAMGVKLETEGVRVDLEDADFHMALSEATHNKVQTHIMYTIYDILRNSIGKYLDEVDRHQVYQQHLKVFTAVKAGDSDLAQVRILEHLDYVELRIKQTFASDNHRSAHGSS